VRALAFRSKSGKESNLDPFPQNIFAGVAQDDSEDAGLLPLKAVPLLRGAGGMRLVIEEVL